MKYLLILLITILTTTCSSTYNYDAAISDFQSETGLQEVTLPSDPEKTYQGKTHRGYDILFTTEVGDVWGRWTTRVTLSQIQDFLSNGTYRAPVTGSQLDRLLSRAIGQPLSIIVIARHSKRNASRLDIITPFSTIQPEDPQPKFSYISMNTGSIYSRDRALAKRIEENEELMDKISNLYSPYIRVDSEAITYIYSGPETDLSAMIRNHGSYGALINSIVDILASIGDSIDS